MQINFINVFLTSNSISLSLTEVPFNKQKKFNEEKMDLLMVICKGWKGG